MHCSVSKFESCSACLGLQEVQSKIRECKEPLDELYIQEAHTKASVNTAHDLITRYLPMELASNIFMLCKPNSTPVEIGVEVFPPEAPFTPHKYQISLGMVCKSWRNIVRSTPELWTDIYIRFPILNGVEPRVHREFLLLSLRLSGSLPLYIQGRLELPFARNYTEIECQTHSSLLEVLNDHSDRWNTLDLWIAPLFLSHIRGVAPGAPNLKLLRIHLTCRQTNRAFLVPFGLPSPQIVEVCGIPFSLIRVSWKNVTKVKLGTLNIGECLELLRQATHLVDFAVDLLPPEDSGLPDLGEVFTASRLASWKVYIFNMADALFSRLVLPSLVSLDLSGCCSLDSLGHLLSRSMCPLQFLSFSEAGMTPAGVIPVLQATPLLKQLVFSKVLMHGLDELFLLLARTKLVSEFPQDPTTVFLPRLEELFFIRMREYLPPWHLVPSLFPPTLYLANTQYRPLRKLELHIDLDLDLKDYLDKNLVLEMQEIQQRGYDIIIWNEIFCAPDAELIRDSYEHHFGSQTSTSDDPGREGRPECFRY